MDAASEAYAQARATFRESSGPVNEVTDSILGGVSDMKNTQLKTLAPKIFDAAETNPEVVKRTREMIDAVDPGAYDELLRVELERRIGKARTPLEKTATELIYAAAMLSGAFNDELKENGSEYGILGGLNTAFEGDPYRQITVAVAVLLLESLPTPAKFRKAFFAMLRKGEQVLMKASSEVAEAVAEKLVKKFGRVIPAALEQNGMIAPYRLMKKFTEGFRGAYQAHHLLEASKFRELFKHLDSDLGPSVILSEARHTALNVKLALKAKEADTKELLWKAYKEVYEDHPDWLKAIEHYFK